MRSSLRLSLVLSTVGVGALACGNSTEPAAQPRSYDLVSYGAASLPVTLRRLVETSTIPGGPTVTCDDKLTASNLELLTTGRFTQMDSHLFVCDDGRPDAASQLALQGTYDTGADTLVLNADLGSGTSYVSLARVSDGSLTIYRREAATTGGASSVDPTELVFRRAGS